MTVEEMNVYKMRITQAGIAELVVVMLDMDIQWIHEALHFYKEQDWESYTEVLSKAQSVQTELMNVMNMENEVARDAYALFLYINRQLVSSRVKLEPQNLAPCKDMLRRLRGSFEKLVPTDGEGPLMAQSEKVYAGLTYGSDGLVESSVGGTEYKV